jgi:hypothetical protein
VDCHTEGGIVPVIQSRPTLGKYGRAWVVGVVLYAIARAAIVWPTLGTYGVNPLVFLVIDVATAWPYAVGQVRIIQGIRARAWHQIQVWSLIALASFVAPYAYIVGAGSGELPVLAYLVIAALVLMLAAASVARIVRQGLAPSTP